MNATPKPPFRRWPTWAGAGAGLFWGGAIALLADQTGFSIVLDYGIRAAVVVGTTLLGAGFGWLCCCGIDALIKSWKR